MCLHWIMIKLHLVAVKKVYEGRAGEYIEKLVNKYLLKLMLSNFYNKGASENIKPNKMFPAVWKLMIYFFTAKGKSYLFYVQYTCSKEKN